MEEVAGEAVAKFLPGGRFWRENANFALEILNDAVGNTGFYFMVLSAVIGPIQVCNCLS